MANTLPLLGGMLIPMARMPKEVADYLRRLGRKYGKLGGQTAAKNMTAEQRSARAKKASEAAAKKRTAQRLARERATRARKTPRRAI